MATFWRIALGALGGGLLSLLSGFLAAIIALFARRWRNGKLFDRGLPGIKDVILPLPFVIMSAIVGLPLSGILAVFMPPLRAAIIGAIVPGGLLALTQIIGSIVQAYSD